VEVTANLHVLKYLAHSAPMSHGIAARSGRIWFGMDRSDPPYTNEKDAVGLFVVRDRTTRTYDIPTTAATPEGLALSPDGTVVIAESNANAIGELRGDRIVEHRLPSGLIRDSGGPHSVTVTRDGTIYFSVLRSAQIGSLSPSGAWRFARVFGRDGPRNIGAVELAAVGNVVWYTDPSGAIGSIERVGVATRVKRHVVPWAGAQPMGIAATSKQVCFSLNQPYLGCYNFKTRRFRQIQPPQTDTGGAELAITRGRLWFGIGRVVNYEPWSGAIGFVPLN
jgi:streptogramin lyase